MTPDHDTTPGLQRAPEQSVQSAVVLALRRQIEALPTGAYLGSESEILARLGVSSPTLRQAARLLEQQQMLSVVRGKGGGYFGRRPDGGATTRAAALYLDGVGTSRAQVRAAALPLMVEASRLAARSADAGRRRDFAATLDRMKRLAPDADARVVLTQDRILTGELLELAGNPAITLFLQVIYRLGRSAEARRRAFEAHPEWSAQWLRHAARFGDAILEGDADLAALLTRRGSRITAEWLEGIEAADADPGGDGNRFWKPLDGQASALQATADALRQEILAHPPGAFLGREEALADRYQVSRHTLRQAAVVMQHNGLLTIKRGVAGGYVATRPDIGHVVRSAAAYLELNGATLRHLMAASGGLVAQACRLAADNPDPDARAALRRAGEEMARAADDLDAEAPAAPLLRAEFRLVDAILGMAGSHPIALFVKCLYRYGGLISQPVHAHPSRIVPWRDARLALVEAILESDGEVAMIVSDRIARLLAAWLD